MIDLNCDLGEGLHNEHLLMPFISSCNISCGAHAGSVEIIDKVIALAIKHQVKIGAHPGFADRENFGRKVLDVSNDELQESVEKQLQLFANRAAIQNATIHHVKPHGALYNLIAINREKAAVVVKAIKNIFKEINIYVPYNSEIEKAARENNINIIYEAFADRNYNNDLTLVSRSLPYAIITDKEKVFAHVQRMVDTSEVKTVQDTLQHIKAQTFCIHGDHKNSVEILAYLNEKIQTYI